MLAIFREVMLAPYPTDGLVFDPQSLRAVEVTEDQDYPGVQLTLRASLDGAAIPLQVDVAFGQAVAPEPQVVDLPTLLQFPAPRLRAYPPEAVVAEKFEALVKLGMINSRLKDFYDLWYLLSRLGLEPDRLGSALAATFARRRTLLPAEIPAALTPSFFDDLARRRQWKVFLDRAGIPSAEQPTLEQAMVTIRDVLMPVARQLLASGR
ncbi:MAG: nucleotidyl transferase AbiEii/AbiGii toxin family protein [Gemmatimonadetes bacterium]|nr:nucleotidyl transferase AbiEii/AbiGii toxin family protein [Gemmatimonadota bacterium]